MATLLRFCNIRARHGERRVRRHPSANTRNRELTQRVWRASGYCRVFLCTLVSHLVMEAPTDKVQNRTRSYTPG